MTTLGKLPDFPMRELDEGCACRIQRISCPKEEELGKFQKKIFLENVVNQPEKIMNKIIFSNEDSMDLAYHCLKVLLLFKVINMEHYKMFKFRPSRIGKIRTRKF